MAARTDLREGGVLALVVAIAVAILLPVLDAGFLTDDYHYIRTVNFGPRHAETWNPDEPLEALRIFTEKGSRHFELYRPLVVLSYAVQFRWTGLDQKAFMLWNLASHLLGGVSLFLVLRRLLPETGALGRGLGVLIWLISPIQLEVVHWCATRSDGLSFVFGSLALWLKLGDRRRIVAPAFFFLCAMLAKEQSLFWGLALALLDFLDAPEAGTTTGRVTRMLRRNWPLLLVVAAYFAVRYRLFGSLFATNAYAEKEFVSFYSPELRRRYLMSFIRMLAPVSTLAFAKGVLSTALTVGSLYAVGALALTGLPRLLARPSERWAVVGLLFVGPFTLAVMMNEVGANLINTRACYTPMLALAALTAAAVSGPARRVAATAALVLLTCHAVAVRPSQALYVDTCRDVEAALAVLRQPLADPSLAAVQEAAVLGFDDLDRVEHFNGSFHLAGAVDPALKRPFIDRDWVLRLVGADARIAGKEHWTTLEDLFSRDGRIVDRGDIALVDFDAAPSGSIDHSASLVYGGRVGGDLAPKLMEPAAGLVSAPIGTSDSSASSRFTFTTSALATGAALHLHLFGSFGRELATQLVAPYLRSDPIGEGIYLHTVELPSPSAEVVARWPARKPFIWFVEIVGADGGTLARSDLRLFTLAKD